MKIQQTTRTRETKIDKYIREKMKILEDFTVVNKDNADEIESELYRAVRNSPWRNHETVIDAVAKSLIMAKLDEYDNI